MNAIATNIIVDRAGRSYSVQHTGITANRDIPTASVQLWKLEALRKVNGFEKLASNWDGWNSEAPNRATRQTAIDLLLSVPGDYETVRVVPVSGGGYQFEWSIGSRELEISIDGNANIEALRIKDGIPLEDEEPHDLVELFNWISSR